uniref:Glucuronosyltransferase n=1 Tax=Tetranychus urticae TaxID=32264 RepID=T1L0V1_TETUR
MILDFVDQLTPSQIYQPSCSLPRVDLFITHGGTNSFIESLAAGKPLIVIPQFGDQLDNAQRIADLNLGVRINLHEFSDEMLLKAIEDVLNDKEIHSNVARVKMLELKKSDLKDKVISLIEQLARNKVL